MKTQVLQATSEFVAGTLDLVDKMAADLATFETREDETRTKSASLASEMRRLGLILPHEEKEAADMLLNPSTSADMMDVFLKEYKKLQSEKSAGVNAANSLGSGSGGEGGSNDRNLPESDLVCLKAAGLR